MESIPPEIQDLIFAESLENLRLSQGISQKIRSLMRKKYLEIRRQCDHEITQEEVKSYLNGQFDNIMILESGKDTAALILYLREGYLREGYLREGRNRDHSDLYTYSQINLYQDWHKVDFTNLKGAFGLSDSLLTRSRQPMVIEYFRALVRVLPMYKNFVMFDAQTYHNIISKRSKCMDLDPNYSNYKTISYIRRIKGQEIFTQYLYLLANLYLQKLVDIKAEVDEVVGIKEIPAPDQEKFIRLKINVYQENLESVYKNE